MTIGLGIDLIDIARIEKALERTPRFLERLYTEEEQALIAQKGAQTAAGFFAAKEAVSKALGTGLRGFSMRDIAVTEDELGCPHAVLTGGALSRFNDIGGERLTVSVTHAGGMAAAVAVIDGQNPPVSKGETNNGI